ncbi:2-dehydropantoate 2-reductase [Sulfurimonas sp. HSL3-7]|uniref:ketopantoate reductase family protein n=1 Tax=Sulfonitrofixus jiaomeiensis TaxID=3131938 RepID=UPI0031FA4620
MRIVVAGIGGVGGYIGAHLCALDDEVVFIARGDHAAAIRENGLLIKEDEGSFTAHPDAVMSAGELVGDIDLLLLCVKSYDIASALAELSGNITPSTVIVPFANGVEHKEKIASLVEAKVLHGALHILAHKESDGVIIKKGKVFAAIFGSREYPAETAAVAALFEKAGLRHKTPEKIEEALWRKYLFISAFAALTTYFDTSMRKVYEQHRNWADTLLKEIADVADAKGIHIQDEVEKALRVASVLPEEASSSMHLDFQHGRKTELETLCGYVVREGKKLRLPTPLMAKIYGVLKGKVV